jgi:ribonuclease P protein component
MTGPDRSGTPGDRSERWGFARLTKRVEFQRVAKGQRGNARCVSLQSVTRVEDASADVAKPRIGLTITRKVGCSVERNRIRRRLRAALALGSDLDQRPTNDYVVVARRDALTADFQTLRHDLARVFKAVHQPRDSKRAGQYSRTPTASGGAVQK